MEDADAAHFRAIAELDGGAAWVYDCGARRLSFCSDAIERLTGFAPAEVAAHVDGTARAALLETLCGGIEERLRRHAAGDASRVRVVRRYDQPRKDGGTQPLEVSSAIVCDGAGQASAIVGVVRDDSARREREQEQRRFASMLNHEFRTPLSTIDGAVQRLEATNGHADQPTRDRYRKIQDAVDRLIRMLDDYLSPDRMADVGRAKHATSAEPLVLMRNAAQHARAAGRTVHIDGGDLPGALRCQPDGIAMALRVLVDNALQYTPAATPIHLSGRRADGGVVLEVRDEGPGVPSADQPRLFDKGFRGSNAAGLAGSGLGLYMAKSVVEVHGGSVSMENGEKCGAVFKIWLPLSR
ncbi:MAG TPA: PAS domain-containing sensor histidine kinase [Telluria sp.]|nr:PAS domain-containing sensor histidine kinase [Telluria sp.]